MFFNLEEADKFLLTILMLNCHLNENVRTFFNLKNKHSSYVRFYKMFL